MNQNEQTLDFIKQLKLTKDALFIIYEMNRLDIMNIQDELLSFYQMPTSIYDVIMLNNNLICISLRGMPLTIRSIVGEDVNYKLIDKKVHSEDFLAPLSMQTSEFFNTVIGGGKGFLHQYDLNSMKIITQKVITKYDFVSAIDIDNISPSSIGAIGLFNKTIKLIDLKNDKVIQNIKIHLGGITHLQFDSADKNYFYSCARFDNLIYQWDVRNASTFVNYFERKNCTNQRTNFYIDKSKAFVGNDDGTAYLYSGEQRFQYQINDSNTCVHSCHISGDTAFCAFGERSFLDKSTHTTGISKFKL